MSVEKKLNVPINRVEGDLDLNIVVKDGVITDAESCGTLYRGFERIVVGRKPYDSLVITPRICGICSTAHLVTATESLEMVAEIEPPPNAVALRNIALMVEQVQSDVRHSILTFAPDFTDPAYHNRSFHEEAVKRYTPFKGDSVISTISETAELLDCLVILGGQWPHSSFIIPGGLTSVPTFHDICQCGIAVKRFRYWYEKRILGCSIKRWSDVKSLNDLESWLDESRAHAESDLGFFIRAARKTGLDKIGKGCSTFINFGNFRIPDGSVLYNGRNTKLIPSCVIKDGKRYSFDQSQITESVTHSWYKNYSGGLHPFNGSTAPDKNSDNGAYSWVKAPRYSGFPAETGPLGEMLARATPLFADILDKEGVHAFARQLARMVRPTLLLPVMEKWLSEIKLDQDFYIPQARITDGEGYAMIHGTRGALGHWISLEDDKIRKYQIITPTTWNGSPKDSGHVHGPWEQAVIGTEIHDETDIIKVQHIIRSFDPCLVCAVHRVEKL